MSATTPHIEWVHARYVQATGIAHPGEFENDGIENEVGCVVLVSGLLSSGIAIQGRPEELISLAWRIMAEANKVKAETDADPALLSLYGIIT